MPTSIRLGPRAERALRRLAKLRGQSKSDVVRAAIESLEREAAAGEGAGAGPTAYDRVAHILGIADSGGAGLSTDTGAGFRALLTGRRRARPAR